MRAEDMFKKYKEMCKQLSMTAYEISHFTGISQEDVIDVLNFAHNDDGIKSKNSISRRTETIALISEEVVGKENKRWLNFLLDRYKKLDDEICFFEYCIRQMGEKKADILFEMLDGELTWNQIADQYDVSRSLLGVYRKQAIKEINRCYEMREEQKALYWAEIDKSESEN
ncbi:hypothetical protein [Eubacterium sp. AB3007]|uniref:hypothetical protein n=1 Tax=Eubacterium sp. AB3007 TaxID=1392487 RepID=UPI000486F5C4|nr:hypothetical protein [Eubacterium sp. AB3007]